MGKKSPKPTGLAISRSGQKFNFSWNNASKTTDHDIKVYVNGTKVLTKDLGKNTKSYSYSVTFANYWPRSGSLLSNVGFKVRQKVEKKSVSDYTDTKTFSMYPPLNPGYVKPSMYNSLKDTFSYSWGTDTGDDGASVRPFTEFQWMTCLVNEGQGPNWDLANSQRIIRVNAQTGAKYDSPSTGSGESGPVIISESLESINAKKKRYFAVRARGPAGDSGWTYSEHQFGSPNPIVIDRNTINYMGTTETRTTGSFSLGTISTWADESLKVQYAVTEPFVEGEIQNDWYRSALEFPIGFNSWTDDGNGFSGTNKLDTYTFDFPVQVLNDQCLFIRVNRIYDGVTVYGEPAIINTKAILQRIGVSQPVRTYNANVPEAAYRYWTTHSGYRVKKTGNKIYIYKTSYKAQHTIIPIIGSLSNPSLDNISVDYDNDEITVTVKNNTKFPEGHNDSFIAVYIRTEADMEPTQPIGIIPFSGDAVTRTFPAEWDKTKLLSIGIQSFVADYTPTSRGSESGVVYYTIDNILFESDRLWEENAIPMPPTNVTVSKTSNGVALVTWDWNWSEADSAEISWATEKTAWESTSEPSNYVVRNTRVGKRYVNGLSAETYYFRVRFIKTEGDTMTYGTYSSFKEITLSSAPNIPTLTLSSDINTFAQDEEVTVYWGYESTDGTNQAFAQLAEATRESESDPWTYNKIESAVTETDDHITFIPERIGWTDNSTHYICVIVKSASGIESDGWSEPVQINIAQKPQMSFEGFDDVLKPATIEGETPEETINYPMAITSLPIEFDVHGAGVQGTCTVVIKREEDYDMERPDDSTHTGHEGETIVSKSFSYNLTDESEDDKIHIVITEDDIIGNLDYLAAYNLVISIKDSYGQVVTSDPYIFHVVWDYRAQIPYADISLDKEEDVCYITPYVDNEIAEGDYCQIYRLSADRPQLILDRGEFNQEYVDIYPTYGDFGGYRIVYVTKYGDYKTDDNVLAWSDYTPREDDAEFVIDSYDKFLVSVEFDDETFEFQGNINVSHSWDKDFQSTKYLGGSIQGDWNEGVARTGSISGVIPVEQESEASYYLRLLATYAGICHIRTPDGSNFYGNIQVKDDREEKFVTTKSNVSLDYTRVDSVETGLLTYQDWAKEY